MVLVSAAGVVTVVVSALWQPVASTATANIMLDREMVVVFMMGSFYYQNNKVCMDVSYTARRPRTIAICAKP
jgi:hypothetical protein